MAAHDADRELLLKEADWVWSEMEDFVKQIQRYRLSYVTALFASIGWILGQLIDPQNTALTLTDIRRNPAIAAIILLVPMINGLFFLLMMEAARQVQSLARYRFLLSCELGSGSPTWRWELFKTTPEGSIRHWTNPSNVFLGLFAAGTSIGAFIFANPAVSDPTVNAIRWASASFTSGLAISVVWAALPRRYRNAVADPPPRHGSPPEPNPEQRPMAGGATYGSLRPEWARDDGREHSCDGVVSSPELPVVGRAGDEADTTTSPVPAP